jgi:hypothetical protein
VVVVVVVEVVVVVVVAAAAVNDNPMNNTNMPLHAHRFPLMLLQPRLEQRRHQLRSWNWHAPLRISTSHTLACTAVPPHRHCKP